MRSSTTLTLALGTASSVAALLSAHALGGVAEHGLGSTAPLILTGVLAGSLLHVPAQVAMKAIEIAADGLESRLEAQGDRPPMNEDLQRAGRNAALDGVKVGVNRYLRCARENAFDHDLKTIRRFRRKALKWIHQQKRATRRHDRPDDGAWLRPGLGIEAVIRAPRRGDMADPRVQAWEAAAWLELVEAMKRCGMETPPAFKPFFLGEVNCGLGWRRAGHLLFMRELKRNHDAFVGFMVESLGQIGDAQKGPVDGRRTYPRDGEGGAAPVGTVYSLDCPCQCGGKPRKRTPSWRSRLSNWSNTVGRGPTEDDTDA